MWFISTEQCRSRDMLRSSLGITNVIDFHICFPNTDGLVDGIGERLLISSIQWSVEGQAVCLIMQEKCTSLWIWLLKKTKWAESATPFQGAQRRALIQLLRQQATDVASDLVVMVILPFVLYGAKVFNVVRVRVTALCCFSESAIVLTLYIYISPCMYV